MNLSNFDQRSSTKELLDNLALNQTALTDNLLELEAVNKWLGGRSTLIAALDQVYEKYPAELKSRTITIGDLGCGGGDLLRAIQKWAGARKLSVRLVGIDANPFMTSHASGNTETSPAVQFMTLNVFSDSFKAMRFDITCLNTFCHHFSDPDLICLLRQLARQTNMAIIVNDLHRHWIAYVSIQLISRLLNFSYLARHDGPLSVLRAFRKHELINLIETAGIEHYQIHWRWPFRWKMVAWTK